MSFILENLILESCSVALAPTAAAPLEGSLPGYFPFSDKYANGDTCHYLIRGVDVVGRPTGQVEIGAGTILVSGGAYSLRRDKVYRSTNANAAVSFTAGTKFISVSTIAPASDDIRFDLQAAMGLDAAGQVAFFPMSVPPAGWLKLNGAAISRTTYARLFARIGTIGGVGDGSTTFNLPDARGEFLRAWDDGRALDSGRAIGTVQTGLILSHNHGLNDPGHAHGVYDAGHAHGAWTDSQGNHSHANGTVRTGLADGNAGYGIGIAGGYQNNVLIPGMHGQHSTDTQGLHGHGVGIALNGTGVAIYAAGTGQSVAAAGGAENRPRNLSLLAAIKY
jgi:microcystin-dependent protein